MELEEEGRRETHELRSVLQGHDSTDSRSDIDLVELLVGFRETDPNEPGTRKGISFQLPPFEEEIRSRLTPLSTRPPAFPCASPSAEHRFASLLQSLRSV